MIPSSRVRIRLVTLFPLFVALGACAQGQPEPAASTAEPAAEAEEKEPTPMERGAALRVPAFHGQAGAFKEETTTIVLQPGEGMEYKYRLEPGGTFLYSWSSSAPVHVEMHSQPDNAPRGYADSFELNDALTQSHGSYTAAYPGIHGWYWENRTADPVTVTLTSAGFFSESQEFRKGQPVMRRAIE
jgi:hypothetical protein